MRAGDFTLLDSGVRQRVESVALADVPVSLLLVLDTSLIPASASTARR